MDCSCRLELRLYKSVCLNIVSSIVMTDWCWLTVLCSTDPGLLSSIRSRRAQSHLGQEMSAERGAGQGWAAATVVIPTTDTLYILLCSQGETEPHGKWI